MADPEPPFEQRLRAEGAEQRDLHRGGHDPPHLDAAGEGSVNLTKQALRPTPVLIRYERLARKALRIMSERLGSSVRTSFSHSRGIASTLPPSRTTAERYSACPVSMFSSPKNWLARKTTIVRASPAKSSTISTSPSRMAMKSLEGSPAL